MGFVRFNHQNESDSNRLVKYEKKVLPKTIKAGHADLWFYVFGNFPGNLSNVSLRTRVVSSVGMFDQSLPFAGDFEFWHRASKKYDVGVQSEVIVQVRVHKNQASNYLNLKGELVEQKIKIANKMYRGLIASHPHLMRRLKFHGTLQYDALDRYLAVKFLLKGNKEYLKEVNKHAAHSECIRKNFKWAIFFISLGGRIGRVYSAKRLLQAFQVGSNAI